MKKNLPIALTCGVYVVFFLFVHSYYSGADALQRINLGFKDVLFKLRAQISAPPDAVRDFVMVTIDEESCQRLDTRWPWPRATMADLADAIRLGYPKLVVMNFSFTGNETDPAATERLAEILSRTRTVVIGQTISSGGSIVHANSRIAAAAAAKGYLEKIVDEDFVIRRSNLFSYYRNLTASEISLPLAAALFLYGESAPSIEREGSHGRVSLGPQGPTVHTDAEGAYTINYLAAWQHFEKIPAWKIMSEKAARGALSGKLVFVGLASSTLADTHLTPLGMMPGAAIQANEVLALLSKRHLTFVPDELVWIFSFIIGLLVAALYGVKNFWLGLAATAVSFFGLFVGCQGALMQDRLFEPLPVFLGPFAGSVVGIAAGAVRLLSENQGLYSRAVHDKLTGLYKYEYLREMLDEEWKRAKKTRVPLAVIMTDLDRFKSINDTLGHETGNDMIKRAGQVIQDTARRYDVVSRYGGDEFVVLLRQTNLEEAQAYRTRLREAYEAMARQLEQPMLRDSTISVGVASFDPVNAPDAFANPQKLIEAADKDLFEDKRSRRAEGR